MSTNSTRNITGNSLTNDSNTAKIFVLDNRYITGNVVNSSYTPMVLKAGTLMGRIAGTSKLFPFTAESTNGTQFPVGVLAADYSINDGSNADVQVCVAGDVVKDLVIFFDASDTFASVVSGKTVYDRVGSDSVGIKLVDNNEMTAFDN